MENNIKQTIKTYIISIAIPLAVGLASAFLTMENMTVYSEVVTPPLSPPSILFPIVWTALYILMGIGSAMIWQKRKEDPHISDESLLYYAMSLVFNFTWSIIFFNFRRYLFAFIWLIVLLYLIIRTILEYRKISKAAAYLQIPYAIWVTFAGYLNFGVWYLNR
ncbi:MAG: tryptophan-rich sensory protein [Ruminococcaceae bacterium]|nr:tryptophan-rich sensory protein [Oscillospiraceae bacterium]